VGLATALCSLPPGWIALKTRRYTFIVIAIAIYTLIAQLPNLLSGNFPGLSEITLPIPVWSGDFFNLPFYYAALALLLLAVGVSWWIRRSKYGLGLFAIRDDEDRALGLGLKVGHLKLTSFMISAGFAGMAGAMTAYFLGFISPTSVFDHSLNIAIPLMVFLGGSGTLWGPVIGAFIVVVLQQYLTLQYGTQSWNLILYGLMFLVIILFLPEGILPSISKRWMARMSISSEPVVLETTTFFSNEVNEALAVPLLEDASPSLREVIANDVSQILAPKLASASIPRRYAEPVMNRGLIQINKGQTQRIRAQRLVPLPQAAPEETTTHS
jgi:branched-chain amino acid transport system permease protein